MRTFALSTGSSGNCFYVESSNGCKVLVDIGLPFAKVESILESRSIDYKDIDAVLITHEHSDHMIGLKGFMRRTECDVFISKGTYSEISDFKDSERSKRIKFIKHHDSFSIGDLKTFVISKPHDAKEAVNFILNDDNRKLGVFTDLGHVDDEMKHALKNLDIMYIEANYCEEKIGEVKHKYHDTYLNRLMSDYGHLGLHQTIDALIDCAHDMQKIVLSHISENTNSYENSYTKVKSALEEVGKFPEVLVGFQSEPTEWLE